MPKLNASRSTGKSPAKKVHKSLPPAQASGNQPIPYRVVSEAENESMARVFATLGADCLAIAAKLALRGVRR